MATKRAASRTGAAAGGPAPAGMFPPGAGRVPAAARALLRGERGAQQAAGLLRF